jgi:hypothetical protein
VGLVTVYVLYTTLLLHCYLLSCPCKDRSKWSKLATTISAQSQLKSKPSKKPRVHTESNRNPIIMDSLTLPFPALSSATHRPIFNPRSAVAFRCFHNSVHLPTLRGSPLFAANTLTANSVPVCLFFLFYTSHINFV